MSPVCFETGGAPGSRGLNLLVRATNGGRTINLGPKTAVPVLPGVSIVDELIAVYFSRLSEKVAFIGKKYKMIL